MSDLPKIYCELCHAEMSTKIYDIGIYIKPCSCRETREKEIVGLAARAVLEECQETLAAEAEAVICDRDEGGNPNAVSDFVTACYQESIELITETDIKDTYDCLDIENP